MARSLLLDREERRELALDVAGATLRADAGSAAESFVGHAAVFDQRTAIGNPLTWGFYEQVSPGAFTKTLSEGDARMLIDQLPEIVKQAAQGLSGANLTVLNGADGLGEIATGLVGQGLAIFDSLRSGLGPHGSADGSGELEAPTSHDGR